MTTRYFKVIHKAGAFIDGVHYPCADDQEDVTESIVPLDDSVEGFKEPLWGVEVDQHGNEIGKPKGSARDKMGDALGNKIAGTDPKHSAHGSKAEAAQRKQTILDTLQLLDHDKDDDWTDAGKAKVDVVANASGLENLTRAEIDEAAPDFVRTKK